MPINTKVPTYGNDDFDFESRFTASEYTAEDTETEPCKTEAVEEYILNTDSKKIHRTTCGTGDRIKKENRQRYVGDLEALFQKGYTTCGNCFP